MSSFRCGEFRAVVTIYQTVLPHYRHEPLRRLRRRLEIEGVELKLIYGRERLGMVPRTTPLMVEWAEERKNYYLELLGVEVVFQAVRRRFGRNSMVVVEAANRLVHNYVLLILSRIFGVRFVFWGHGRNFQSRPGTWREWVKRSFVSRADWWLAYTVLSRDVVIAAGADHRRVTVVQNAIDTDALRRGMERVGAEALHDLRSRLGVNGDTVGIFCGGMYAEKDLGFLLEAAEKIRMALPDFELIFVGSGPDEEMAITADRRHSWVHFLGPVTGEALAPFMAVSAVMLMPGLVGLVVVDSFVCGLPLFTTDRPGHSPEIVYLKHGENGWIAPNNSSAYAEAVIRFFRDVELRGRLVEGCHRAAAQYTVDEMVENFAEGVLGALSTPRPRVCCELGDALANRVTVARRVGFTKRQKIVLVVQRFLPYHRARLRCLQEWARANDAQVVGVEVASRDASYGVIGMGDHGCEDADGGFVCLFPGSDYHNLTARVIHRRLALVLAELDPDLALCPATPFPEGMAVIRYGLRSGCRVLMMDDAWEQSDLRGILTRSLKREIHRCVFGVFAPAYTHSNYFESLGFERERQYFGCDVVDNEEFVAAHPNKREGFLFVGRDLAVKGVDVLVEAYRHYTCLTSVPTQLDLIGPAVRETMCAGMRFHGVVNQLEVKAAMARARFLIVPSLRESWGLVINEALAAGLVVIASDAVGAAQSLLLDSGAGIVVPVGDVAALAAALLDADSMSSGEYAERVAFGRSTLEAYGLDRYPTVVAEVLNAPRRESPGWFARALVGCWPGRVRKT